MGNEDPVFLPGTLDMLILKALSRESRHGYAIALGVEEAAQLEPVQRRVERTLLDAQDVARRLLHELWGTSDNNRRAKYYRLTPQGRRQ